jgi:hypothetical protein
VTAATTPSITPASRTLPRTSSRATAGAGRAVRDSATAAPSASGTFSQNRLGHGATTSSAPPTTGPTATPSATTPVQPATARDRSCGTAATTAARVAGMTSAAARPVRTRAATSTPADGAIAATTDPAANPSRPARIVTPGPIRSAIAPPSKSGAANAST